MAKAEWGLKRVCLSCGTRYYDMKKKQPTCPSCGVVFDPEAQNKSRRSRASAEERLRKTAPAPETVEDLPLIENDEQEDAVIEDTDELADDVDVEEVVEVEEDEPSDDR